MTVVTFYNVGVLDENQSYLLEYFFSEFFSCAYVMQNCTNLDLAFCLLGENMRIQHNIQALRLENHRQEY